MKKPKIPNISQLFDSRKFNLVFSVVVAVICWAFVALTIQTDYDGVIEDVPVNFVTGDTAVRSQGLSVIDTPQATIDIRVIGDRALVGGLRASDFNVTVRYDAVTSPGTYTLPIVVTKVDSYADFEILSITPTTTEIAVDRIESVTLPVTVDIKDIVIASGYIAGTPSATPAEITVQGSASEIERVATAVVSYEGGAALSARTVAIGEIKLYDAEGSEIITSKLTMDATEADIAIPIHKMGIMQTKFEYVNAPDGFDLETLQYTINPPVINVAGSDSDIDRAGDLLLGYIDLKTFEMNASYEFDVTLPSGFTNLDNITKAKVTFDTSNLAERTMTVEDIRIRNTIQGMEINLDNLQIQEVTLIGDIEALAALTTDSLIGEINAADINVGQGTQDVPVTIQIPSASNVFAVGEYTVAIEVESQEEN